MYVQLMWRHNSIQRPVKFTEIPCAFQQVVYSNDHINERLLLRSLPVGWLPVGPERVLLAVANPNGSTGQRGLSIFRSWARFFDCYVLELWRETPHR